MRRATPRVEKIFGDGTQTLTCQSDADCAITCKRDGDCCPELCGCSGVMNRKSLDELAAHLHAKCGQKPICPVPTCAGLKRYSARCDQGLCRAEAEANSKK